jgi:hypothetical protein
MRSVDERAKLGIGAQVRVNLGEVGYPVAVVASRGAVFQLHGLVLEARCKPDRGRAQTLDVIDAVQQTLEVAALVVAPFRRIETVFVGTTGDSASVVSRRPVLEPIGHHEVEVLVCNRGSQ